MCRRLLLLCSVLIGLLLSQPVWGQDISEFALGNGRYSEGMYEQARDHYLEVERRYPRSPEVYYNLGNTYYKLDRLGQSILYYEKARLLAPRDRDIQKNLAFVRSLIEYEVEDKRNWYWQAWEIALATFTFEESLTLSLAFFCVWSAWCGVRVFRRHPALLAGIVKWLLVCVCVSGTVSGFKWYDTYHNARAIVTAQNATVHYGPSTGDKIAFRLVEGLKVKIRDAREGWYRIVLLNGQTGWIAASNVELITITE